MIAQWDSSLTVLPVARVMIAQWDSSLSVLPVARVMIAQWDSSLSVLSVARVKFTTMAEYFSWSHVLPCAQFREAQRAEWRPFEKSLQSHEDADGSARSKAKILGVVKYVCSSYCLIREALWLSGKGALHWSWRLWACMQLVCRIFGGLSMTNVKKVLTFVVDFNICHRQATDKWRLDICHFNAHAKP